MNATGVDISKWQGMADYAKLKSKADFVIMRGYFDCFRDVRFDEYYNGSQGIPRGIYQFVKYSADAVTQAGYLAGLYNASKAEAGAWCDFEYYNYFGNITHDVAISWLYKYFNTVESKTGRVCGLYANPNWILYLLRPVPQWLREKPLWVAHWANVIAPTIGEWASWVFWQTTDKGIGADYGVSSGNIDLDRFNGTKEDLYHWCGMAPTEPTDAEKTARLWQAHPELH